MAILGPFIAKNREKRVYFNGHGLVGDSIWAVKGREGRCLILCSHRIDRKNAVRYAGDVLERLKNEGKIAERWPEFDALFDAAERAKAEGWGAEEAPADPKERRARPEHGFEGFPEPCCLIVDHDADVEIAGVLRTLPNLSLTMERLEAGDFLVRNDEGVTLLAIERMTAKELQIALDEDGGGVFAHAQGLRRAGAQAVLLLEGNLFESETAPLGRLSGMMSFLAVAQGICIVPTASPAHSAYTVARMARHALFGFGKEIIAREGAFPGRTARDRGVDGLASIVAAAAGIGQGRATQVVEAFPSLRAVANATVDSLMQVNFIGRGTAEAIVKAFSAEHRREDR